MVRLPVEQPKVKRQRFESREDWLAARNNGIGGSELAAILGESPYDSPYSLWCKKLGLIQEDQESLPEFIKWGNRHEKTIAEAVAQDYNMTVRLPPPFTIWWHKLVPWKFATLDAIQFEPQLSSEAGEVIVQRTPSDILAGAGVLQIKTCDSSQAYKWKDGPPRHYWIQLQHEMDVSDLKWGTLAVLIGGNRMHVTDRIELDEDFLDSTYRKIDEFWNLVQTKVPPPMDDSEPTIDAFFKRAVGQGDRDKVAVVSDADAEMFYELSRIKDAIKALQDREKVLKFHALRIAGEKSIAAQLPNGEVWKFPTVNKASYVVKAQSYRSVMAPRGKNKRTGVDDE